MLTVIKILYMFLPLPLLFLLQEHNPFKKVICVIYIINLFSISDQAKVYAQDNSAFVNVRTPEITKPASAFSKYLKSAISPSALKMKVSPKATFAKKVLLDEFEMNGEGTIL